MTSPAPPRSPEQRVADTQRLLVETVDLWVATADPATGRPWMVPLSYAWDGTSIMLGTAADSRTVRNVQAQPWVRLGAGAVRDVVLIHGLASVVPQSDATQAEGDLFAERAGFDPRTLPDYVWIRVLPQRIQAWREENELPGREIMRDGRWLS